MRMVKRNYHWMLASLGVMSLAVATISWAQREAVQPPVAHDARDLSSVFREVSQKALPSIVSIETTGKARERVMGESPFGEDSPFEEFFGDDPRFRQFFDQRRQELPPVRGMGSGFIIDPGGVIMTNSHVVADAAEVVVRLQDGREFVATDIRTDPQSDVAVVRIENAGELQPLPMGSSEAMQVGDWVLAVGSPFGLDLTVTAGIISAKGRGPRIAERENFLQTDAAINPGNSGGPLLNLNGEVIGINTAISTRGGGSNGVGFTIPIDMARWVADQLLEHGKVNRAYLGVVIQPVSSNLARQFNTAVGEGVIVSEVLDGSPAEEAGLQVGDVILEFNGNRIGNAHSLQGIVEKLSMNKTYQVTVLRDGEKLTLDVSVRELPDALTTSRRSVPSERSGPPPEDSSDLQELGMEIAELTPEIGEQLQLDKDVAGVVVTSVRSNGPAYDAGIRAGDVIQKVGGQMVRTPAECHDAIRNADLSKGVLFLIRSKAGSHFVVVNAD